MTQSDTLVDEAVERLSQYVRADAGDDANPYGEIGVDPAPDVSLVLTALTDAQAENTSLKTEWMSNVLSAETTLRDELAEAKAAVERLTGALIDDADRKWALDTCKTIFGDDGTDDPNDLAAVADRAMKRAESAEAQLTALQSSSSRDKAEIERLKDALTPSAETKAAYIGEFNFIFSAFDEHGEDVIWAPNVPWTTIKEIMAAILARAALAEGGGT